MEPVHNGHPWDHAKWLLYRGGLLIEVGTIGGWSLGLALLAGIIIEGDLPYQVAASTGSTVLTEACLITCLIIIITDSDDSGSEASRNDATATVFNFLSFN